MTAPTIILVKSQLGENIGMCARAMLNCGVTDLRLVAPKQGWPHERAQAASSGALDVIEAKIFETTQEAVADLEFVLATTARTREMAKEVLTINDATKKMRLEGASDKKCGILFGPERTGLENDDIIFADALLNVPLNPEFSSLNLAQAVLLTCFSWLNADNHFEEKDLEEVNPSAPKGEVENLLNHLDDELETSGFFKNPSQQHVTWRNIQNFFFRALPTQQEVNTLHGIISSLSGKKSWK